MNQLSEQEIQHLQSVAYSLVEEVDIFYAQ